MKKDDLKDINNNLDKKILESIELNLNQIEKIWKSDYFNEDSFSQRKNDIVYEIYNQLELESYIQKSFDEIFEALDSRFKQIYEEFPFQVILGIPRGGIIIATLLSYLCDSLEIENVLLNIPSAHPIKYDDSDQPILNLNSSEYDLISNKRILVVDDGVFTGKTIEGYCEKILPYCKDLRTFSLNYNTIFSKIKPDYYIYESRKLIKYPWKSYADPYLLFIDKTSFKLDNDQLFEMRLSLNTNIMDLNIKSKQLEGVLKKYQYEFIKLKEINYLIYDSNYSYELSYDQNIVKIMAKRMDTLFESNNISKKYEENTLTNYQADLLYESLIPIIRELGLSSHVNKTEIFLKRELIKIIS